MVCRLIPEPHNQTSYDLFIGEALAAWADNRVFRDGRWYFDEAGPEWRTVHHVSGGRYMGIGDVLPFNRSPDEGPGA
jgi:flavin reductase (DIM6/NTAB) family NADH-FMN oxidoreductase RutF